MHKKHHHHSSHRSLNGKNFIILPIVFCVLILGLASAIIIPNTIRFYNMASMFFSDNPHDFSDELKNIYVPTSEGLEEDNTDKNDKNKTSKTQPKKTKTVPITEIEYPDYSDQFGEFIMEDCNIKCPLFYGDGDLQLNYGVGIYTGSFIPGYGKPIMIAGHNATYFNGLKYAQKGQIILIRTSYGNYRYEVTDVAVKKHNDKSAYDLGAQEETLTLYTCYPFDQFGLTSQRCFVYAKYISGPKLDISR